ncbi:MAG: hypothetical protein SH850_28630 [Planctomycetaceae bacterium]|nr:hypothetical protein [Planctomycetaceae bacterium]
MAKVTGRITFNGQPLPQAKISFIPLGEKLRPAMGTTDEQGRYVLTTYDPGDGAVIAKHRVAVQARAAFTGKVPSHLGGAYLEEQEDKGEPLIPMKYFSPETSELQADVVKSRSDLDFELTGDAPKSK